MIDGPTFRTALLGLRVADAHRGEVVTGLRAWAWDARLDELRRTRPASARAQEARLVREARAGMNGVLAWHELPFYGGWSATAPDDAQWGAAYQREHTVVIVDPARRLHPVRLRQRVPLRDLVVWSWGADDARPVVRGYPTPVHPVPDGVAAVRARLWDVALEAPAAWALLRVRTNGRAHVGLSGEDGQVVVFVPLPRPRIGVALQDQTWPISVEVAYSRLTAPAAKLDTVGVLPGATVRGDLPTLDAIEGQRSALVFSTWTSADTHIPYVPPPLPADGDLFLASDPRPSAVPASGRVNCLLVTP